MRVRLPRLLRLLRLALAGAAGSTVVTTRKEDLNAILDHFDISIDNPLSVLPQEVAKRFLSTAKEADLYKVRTRGGTWPGVQARALLRALGLGKRGRTNASPLSSPLRRGMSGLERGCQRVSVAVAEVGRGRGEQFFMKATHLDDVYAAINAIADGCARIDRTLNLKQSVRRQRRASTPRRRPTERPTVR